MGKYYQPEIETASREEILRIQNEKICRIIATSWTKRALSTRRSNP